MRLVQEIDSLAWESSLSFRVTAGFDSGGVRTDDEYRMKKYSGSRTRGYTIFSIFAFSPDANAFIEPGSLNPARITFPDEKRGAVPASPR
jgi:hypothetical protein